MCVYYGGSIVVVVVVVILCKVSSRLLAKMELSCVKHSAARW